MPSGITAPQSHQIRTLKSHGVQGIPRRFHPKGRLTQDLGLVEHGNEECGTQRGAHARAYSG